MAEICRRICGRWRTNDQDPLRDPLREGSSLTPSAALQRDNIEAAESNFASANSRPSGATVQATAKESWPTAQEKQTSRLSEETTATRPSWQTAVSRPPGEAASARQSLDTTTSLPSSEPAPEGGPNADAQDAPAPEEKRDSAASGPTATSASASELAEPVAEPEPVASSVTGQKIFVCGQHTAEAWKACQVWFGDDEDLSEAQMICSAPPFNLPELPAGSVSFPSGSTKLNVPCYGGIPDEVMALFAKPHLRDCAAEMNIKIPEYKIDSFLKGKMGIVRDMVAAALAREDCIGPNVEAANKLKDFADAFESINDADFNDISDWKKFMANHAAAGWESKLSFEHVLSNFGFDDAFACALRFQTIDVTDSKLGTTQTVTWEHQGLRWVAKALTGFKPAGCLTDVVNLVFALEGYGEEVFEAGLPESRIKEIIQKFGERTDYKGLWLPSHLIVDCESDDMLVWCLVESLHKQQGNRPSVLAQLPEDSAADSIAEHLRQLTHCNVFRDPHARNMKALSQYWSFLSAQERGGIRSPKAAASTGSHAQTAAFEPSHVEEAAASTKQTWVVTGGGDKGGIVCREGCELTSPEQPRLATGARVREVEIVGERLRFEKIDGDGPATGWVSLSLKGKRLMEPEAESGAAVETSVDTAADPPPEVSEAARSSTASTENARGLSEEERKEAMVIFELCDTEGVQSITAQGFAEMSVKHPHVAHFVDMEGMTSEAICKKMLEVTEGGNKTKIRWDQFENFVLHQRHGASVPRPRLSNEQEIDLIFDMCDVLKDGEINLQEFAAFCVKNPACAEVLGAKRDNNGKVTRADDIFKQIDVDGSGQVSRKELRAFIWRQRAAAADAEIEQPEPASRAASSLPDEGESVASADASQTDGGKKQTESSQGTREKADSISGTSATSPNRRRSNGPRSRGGKKKGGR